MREIGVGVLGFGTVGGGVVDILSRNNKLLAERLGAKLVLRGVADLDIESARDVAIDSSLLTTDAEAVIRDPSVDIVVELIGGTGAALSFSRQALDLSKTVVTANKKLLAEHGEDLFELAKASSADLLFEASVGGGIPIIRSLREGLIANRTHEIQGILNGTCNYILTRMEQEGLPFELVLDEAQRLGYAEADPALDVDGLDTAHKACVLASLAYGFYAPFGQIPIEGIRGIDGCDVAYAANLGYRIKLLAVVKAVEGKVAVRVHPALVPLDHMLASVHGVFNAVQVRSDYADDTLYYGRGAGREPTASAVVGDIAEAARNILSGVCGRVPPVAVGDDPVQMMDEQDAVSRHYVRLSLSDQPGVLAQITGILGDCGVSIASALQQEVFGDQESGDAFVPVVILTHEASEAQMREALEKIDALEASEHKPVRFRVAD